MKGKSRKVGIGLEPRAFLTRYTDDERKHDRVRGIRIDYAANKDRTRSNKRVATRSLHPVSNYRVQDSGRLPNELTHETIFVVRKTGVAIV
ncbi:hypothetical protein PIB30_030851 [Stylosanthes scabra]|uniref:Uncharacterized protein n=1 Tax=Stylosanthes scabra TaxID=79078 RepID=A0ABU6UAY2_9FABA|nr:hypothetical protein [Stylosanthes scabra]